MADNKLNYQQARRIRKSKFSDMVLDQLAQQDTGVFGAISKTISLRSQAKIKGIKEKFDPLNIIKFMTFGSRFAPAIAGKLMGRSQKDIDYFTGRTKSVVGGKGTAEKINKLSDKGGADEGINEQLAKIYSFLKSSREDDVRLREQLKNQEEEISSEKERRHKELVDTLQKLMKHMNSGGTATAVKEETSMWDSLWEKLKGLADLVSLMRNTLLEIAKKVGVKVAESLASAGRWGLQAATAFAASGGLTVTGVVAGGAALTYGATKVLENMSDEQLQQLSNDTGSETAIAAQAILSGRKTPEEVEAAKQKANKLEKLLEDAPFLTKYYNVGVREYLRETKKLPKKEIDDLIGPSSEPEPTAVPVKKKENAVPEAPEGQIFDAEGNQIAGPKQERSKPKPPPKSTQPKVEPVQSPPASAPVSNLTNQVNFANIAANQTPDARSINRTINNVTKTEPKSGLRPIEISVRNDEPTFMGLIVDSTRMI